MTSGMTKIKKTVYGQPLLRIIQVYLPIKNCYIRRSLILKNLNNSWVYGISVRISR
jgi:hypothetical protein